MRLDVKKTYKLFIGGKFPRSESGRTYELTTSKGEFVANVWLNRVGNQLPPITADRFFTALQKCLKEDASSLLKKSEL
jgi:hypothetical protein